MAVVLHSIQMLGYGGIESGGVLPYPVELLEFFLAPTLTCFEQGEDLTAVQGPDDGCCAA